MKALDAYRSKRDFRRTPEPTGDADTVVATRRGVFAVQKHAAGRLHFDLRLEHDGVLRSWAVPKGPSLVPGEKRLAVEVEDHPLSYADFEGVIPEGQYGGGTVMLWDRGTWRPSGDPGDDRFDFELEGERLKGAWTLVRMRGRGSGGRRNWLLIRRPDDGADLTAAEAALGPGARSVASGRTMAEIAGGEPEVEASARSAVADLAGARRSALPVELEPQLATRVDDPPSGDAWFSEIKFDGYRILARVERDGAGAGATAAVRLLTRKGEDWTDRFPAIAARLRALPVEEAWLDGEVVAFGAGGVTSFAQLQEALATGATSRLVFQVFDLPHVDGWSLAGAGLAQRKRLLRALLHDGRGGVAGVVRYTDHVVGAAAEFYAHACEMGLEGTIVKRSDAPYRAGRGRDWRKLKCVRTAELLIGGFTEPRGSRLGLGALLLGAYDVAGELRYAGKVGTGFDDRQLGELRAVLQDAEIDAPAFVDPPRGAGIHWVRPERIAHVAYAEWTRDGRLRHPVFRGLREDLDPAEIRMPTAVQGPTSVRAEASRTPEGGASLSTGRADRAVVEGVRLTHPDKVLYPEQGVTKRDLAEYYARVAEWMLPQLRDRPLTLVRCPEGRRTTCFYQKHPGPSFAKTMPRVRIDASDGSSQHLYVHRPKHLVQLVQAGVLEVHAWGSRVQDLERPDVLVFDLDPSAEVPWRETLRVARELRDRLRGAGLTSFPRTTGGKGLHLVVPIEPTLAWPLAKAFAREVANAHAQDDPGRVTASSSKAKREDRIFLDYLRNARGATAIASYATRARAGAPVAVPVRWDELGPRLTSDRYHVGNVARRLAALPDDPWDGFAAARREITLTTLEAL